MTLQNFIALFRKQAVQTAPMLDIMEGMAERNAKRIEAIKRDMGERWIMHPCHRKERLQDPRPV